MRTPLTPAFGLFLLLGAVPLAAQSAPANGGRLDDAVRSQVVESLATNLERLYVFPDIGNRMAADLRARLKRGGYTALKDGDVFADSLTEQMQAISHDRHLHVLFTADPEQHIPDDHLSPAAQARFRDARRRDNYGFERVEHLAGNVGYLKLNGFVHPDEARATALAALRFLGNSDALIIDLRGNGGGEPAMVALISSVLFPEGKRVHLNDLHWRAGDRVEEFYTDPDLDLPRITGEVYVLTSQFTFSAAEEFTYNLKQLKRATQVGETTGGGANPGEGVRLNPTFGVFIPTGRAVNPITHDNWEGKGCVPEIAVKARDALKTAHIRALQTLIARGTDPEIRTALTDALGEVRDPAPER
jgi:hypothetical protein